MFRLGLACSFSLYCLLPANFVRSDEGVRETPSGFTALFNGQDLTGWHGRQRDLDPRKWEAASQAKRDAWNADMAAHWSVKDGALVNDGQGVYLTTDKEYGDKNVAYGFYQFLKFMLL